jgi:hypothetical protein
MIKMLKKDELPLSLKNRIINLIYEYFYKEIVDDLFIDNYFGDSNAIRFAKYVWVEFFNGNRFEVDANKSRWIIAKIGKSSMKLKWYEIYDYIEFILTNYPDGKKKTTFKKNLFNLFQNDRLPYIFIGNKVCPSGVIHKEGIKEIEKALNMPDRYQPVRNQLAKALEFFSKRPEPDYANSIKESICAVESLITIILGKDSTLGQLVKQLDIHPALKEGFNNLYGWTSDDSGIRHGKSKEPLSCDEPEARYMLITCSAFINYVINKKN